MFSNANFIALNNCPDLVILPVRFDLYRAVSKQIHEIFKRYTEIIEPLSLDEAYLDVSHQEEYATKIAKQIRNAILEETGLTASAGIASNKFLAKIASDWKKPNGQFTITPKIRHHLLDNYLLANYGSGKNHSI